MLRQRQARAKRLGRGLCALGVVLAVGSISPPGGAGATEPAAPVDPGFGQAQAQLLMLDPRSAQLSFGVRFGPTVADHRNAVARAQALSTDYGIIGSALTGEGCAGTPPVVARDQLPTAQRADSRDPESHAERSLQEGPITQSVLAEPRPFARATSRLVEVDLPGLLTVGGATNLTASGTDGAGVPFAEARVEVTRLSLLGGVVELSGLRWEAHARRDAGFSGSFVIGGASIGGTPVPTQDASATVAAVNEVLSTIGIVITPPVAHLEGDTLFVDAIKVGVAPNATRDQLSATVLGAVQPVREQLFAALLEADCGAGAYITVIDILLGSVTGGGSFTAHVGGAQAQLIEAGGNDQLTGAPAAPVPPEVPGRPGAAVGSTAAPSPLPAAAPTSAAAVVATGPAPGGVDAGPVADGALAVGLAALGLGVALVEADRRKMRQAGSPAPSPPPSEAPPA